MKIKFLRSYRSKNGNVVFVYAVSASKEDLEAFKVAQGTNFREDTSTGTPLWFTTRFVGDNGKLVLTTNGNIVPDMSELDKANSLVQQYGGNFGEELAKLTAASFVGKTSTPSANTTPVPDPVQDDLEKL